MALKPGSGSLQGRGSSVMVSPTGAPSISLMPAMTNPTSPVSSDSATSDFGVKRPSLSTWWARPVVQTRIFCPVRSEPFTTRTSDTTPT